MYGFSVPVTDSCDNAVKRVTEAFKIEGFDARRRFAVLNPTDNFAGSKIGRRSDAPPAPNGTAVRGKPQGWGAHNPAITGLAKAMRARLERVRDRLRG